MERARTSAFTNPEAVPIEQPHDLRNYLAPIRLHKWVVIVMASAGFVAGWFVGARQETSYAASTEILVGPGIVSPGSAGASTISMPTEAEVMSSRAVARIARRTLGSDVSLDGLRDRLSVTFGTGSNVLDATYTGRSPEAARDGAQAFGDAYLAFRADPLRTNLDKRIAGLEARLAELQGEYEDLAGRLSKVAPTSGEGIEIQSQLQLLRQQIALTTTQLQQNRALTVDAGTVIAAATLPGAPSGGSRTTSLVYAGVGMVLLLMFGVIAAYVLELVRDAPHGMGDLEELARAPVLGLVHDAGRRRGRGGPILVDEGSERALLQDFRALGSVVLHATRALRPTRLLVTSSVPEEGRTTVAANLAVALASSDTPVILVSADLHAPGLEQLFGRGDADLVDLLEGRATIDEILRPTPHIGLTFLPARRVTVQQRDLLNSDAFDELLDSLALRAEVVILDAPPLVVSDPLALVSRVEGIVHVVDARRVTRRRVARAVAALEMAGGNLVGTVVNRFDPRRAWVGASQYREDSRQRRRYLSSAGSRSASEPIAADAPGA
jgi:tyrosine-protein kinase